MDGGPQLDVLPAARASTQHTMTTWDGAELFYRAWPPKDSSDKAVLLFHRGHEHSGRFQDLVERLALDDFWIFAWDARGHGRTAGPRGYAPSFQALVRDVDCFVRHITQEHDIPVENMAAVANSIGAVLVAAWVHDYAPPLRAMALATPALRVKLYVPLAIPGLRILERIKDRAFVTSYVRPAMLTHDQEMARQYAEDPLITRDIAVNVLLDMYDTSTRLMKDAGAIHTPTLILSAGADWVVATPPQRRFFQSLSSTVKEMEVLEGFYHGILHERDRDRPIAKIRQFLIDAFERPQSAPSLIDADRHGYTKDAYDRLRRPLSPFSPRNLYFASVTWFLKSLGRLSEGIRIGWRTGFNSGQSLDHVYRNQAAGWTPLGRLADRIYLNSTGWRGIRQRKLLLEQLIARAVRSLHGAGRSVRLLDIASGPGRYVLDAIEALPDIPVEAILRDSDPAALDLGRKIATQRGLVRVTFEQGDALDEASLAAIRPRPNVAVVSGLYELIAENGPVFASLQRLAAAMEDDGLLIYTNQPWHPELELIARSLIGLDGKPWVMRCRTQLEMDQLVQEAGFQKLDMLATKDAIFTVSLARRVTCV
jgi:alpha-beta hydrolase superfamily lysophospholipase